MATVLKRIECYIVIFLCTYQLIFLALVLYTNGNDREKPRGKFQLDNPFVSHVKEKYPGEGTRILAGVPRPGVGFLTIGVSSVFRRHRGRYLSKTLRSLIDNLTPQERDEVNIVVSLADFESSMRERATGLLEREFRDHLTSGLLRIVHTSKDEYPRLTGLKITHGDSAERIAWRSKRNVDNAFLMLYSSSISRYYIQIEDDVIATRDYLIRMKAFIAINTVHWTCLHFTGEGFIGVMFRSEDLVKVAALVLLFYDEKPIDWMLNDLRALTNQRHKTVYPSPLFYHIGNVSSLTTDGIAQTRNLRPVR